ncbi:unnamed protein product [Fraxinus pennsylvanica]|uniref:RRM domain-containing protein n=1 Tax=Fraxinus pennsylvanica TaxID=56036 RepID=A0AAD2DJ74_9LAMI|nr:unnamed protein product [Fraxinus pennsylvanica]
MLAKLKGFDDISKAHQKVCAMAFLRKAGNILSRTVSNHISQEISTSQSSLFQAIRCMSTSKIFIGGLSFSTDDSGLREAFSKYGEVAEARVIVDRDTGRSRGFGFVTFSTVEDASAAIQALDQQDLHGRRVRVAYANDRTPSYGGGGGSYGSGGGSYGGGGYGGGGGGGGYGGNYGSGGGGGYGGNFGSAGGGGGGYGGNFGTATGGGDGYTGGGSLNYGGDGQNFGVARGGEGLDTLSIDNNMGPAGSGFVQDEGVQLKFDAEESKNMEGAVDSYDKDEPVEGNYRDDNDTPDNFADRRG